MRPFLAFTAVVLAFGLGSVRAEDTAPKPPAPPGEKPPAEKPAERGVLGFRPVAVPLMAPEARTGLGVTALFGVIVVSVTPNAPADKAGLKMGDMLLKFAGKEMPDTTTIDTADGMAPKRFGDAFMKLAEGIKPGSEVEIVVKRKGTDAELVLKAIAIDKATLEKIEKQNKDGPAKPKEPTPVPEATDRGYVGFDVRPVASLSPKQKKRWRVKAESGVVAVRVLKGSPAQKAGLANGDVLVKFAGVALPTVKELQEAKDARDLVTSTFAKVNAGLKPGIDVEIVVEREGQPVTLTAVAVDRKAMDEIEGESDEDEIDDEGPEKDER
jgi:S1-C subfamily serine protease